MAKKEKESLICDQCARSYHNLSNLKRHKRKFHAEGLKVKGSRDPLRDESKSKKIDCEVCRKTFSIRSALYRHCRKFHPENSFSSVECDKCDKEFANQNTLDQHYKMYHEDENVIPVDTNANSNTKIKCEKCDAKFSYRSSLKRHVERFHAEIIWVPKSEADLPTIVECAKCGRTFNSKSNLKRHLQAIHPETMCPTFGLRRGIHVCDVCFGSFYDKSSLNRHKKTIHGVMKCDPMEQDSPDVFECFHCSAIFDKKLKIKSHIFRVHLPPEYQIKPMCDQCGQYFHNSSNLNRHRTKMHPPGEVVAASLMNKRPSVEAFCEVCGHSFFTRKTLNRHRKRIHGLEPLTNNEDLKPIVRVQCEECGNHFSNVSNLYRHQRLGHREKKNVTEQPFVTVFPVVCDHCGKNFFNNASLKRHQLIMHVEGNNIPSLPEDELSAKPLCVECDRYFHDKSTLNRHKKKIHGVAAPIFTKLSNETVNEHKEEFCEQCELYFFGKRSLKRHRIVVHNEVYDVPKKLSGSQRGPYICAFCHKKFKKRCSMFSHVRKKHPASRYKKHLLESRLCELCGQNFANKSSLLRHKRTIHRGKTLHAESSSEEEIELFECFTCGRKFRRKDSLVAHIRARHPVTGDFSSLFECNECGKRFTRKHAIRRHLHTIHASNEVKAANFKCTQCGSFFRLRHIAKTHYERDHGIKMQVEKLKFETMDDFEAWRTEVQRNYVTQFVRSYISKTATYTVTRYICHRSGMYKDHSKGAQRKRSLKESGSKKIQGYCPAEILLQVHDDGYHVQFQSAHVGHPIATADELRHIFLDKEQKRIVAEQLIQGVPRAEILKGMSLASELPPENLGRLGILNFKDVDNIARSFGIRSGRRRHSSGGGGGAACGPKKRRRRASPRSGGRSSRAFSEEEAAAARMAIAEVFRDETIISAIGQHDTITVESYVIQNKDAFIFYKSQGEEDTIFGTLERDDYVIVLMDDNQATHLQRYGNKVVAFDGTHEGDAYDFILHTLLVVDAQGDGVPAAFLLSNRSDQPVIDIFVRCVQERVGGVAPVTLISDMQTTYYQSWVAFMEPPQFYLFCSAHVEQTWRQYLAKITDSERRALVLRQLADMQQELDEVLFEQKLTTFMAAVEADADDDVELRNFALHFRTVFYENTKHWAYCYRKFAGANTNARIQHFHRTLKEKVAGGKRIKTLSEGLRYLEEYLAMKEKPKLAAELRFTGGDGESPRNALVRSHQLAAEYCAKNVVSIVHIDQQTWQIVSFQELADTVTEIYTIEKVEKNACELYDVDAMGDAVAAAACGLLCDECNICLHEYRCTCVDSCIHAHMCKHIHVLGFYLQTHKLLELKEVEVGEYDAPIIDSLVEETVPSPSTVDMPMDEEITDEQCINVQNSIDSCIKEVITDDGVCINDIDVDVEIHEECVKQEGTNDDNLDQVKIQILEEVEMALSSAKKLPNLDEIRKRFIQPLKLKLMDDDVSTA